MYSATRARPAGGVRKTAVEELNLTIGVANAANAHMIKKLIAKRYQIKIIKGVDMDNDRGKFDEITGSHYREMLEAAQRTGDSSRIDKVFSVGEQVQVKSSKFLVRSIDHFTGIMTLKLLPEKRFGNA